MSFTSLSRGPAPTWDTRPLSVSTPPRGPARPPPTPFSAVFPQPRRVTQAPASGLFTSHASCLPPPPRTSSLNVLPAVTAKASAPGDVSGGICEPDPQMLGWALGLAQMSRYKQHPGALRASWYEWTGARSPSVYRCARLPCTAWGQARLARTLHIPCWSGPGLGSIVSHLQAHPSRGGPGRRLQTTTPRTPGGSGIPAGLGQ